MSRRLLPLEVDEGAVSKIHADLAEKGLLPSKHLVDSGYVTIANLVKSQSGYGVDLVGPPLKTHWYQAETGYDLTHFSVEWQAETVTCLASDASIRAGPRSREEANRSFR
jgi:transposase